MLFRPPLDRRWQVSGGAWVSSAKEYVLPDNDLTRFAPALQVIEVPGDHDSMVLEPNVRVLAAAMKAGHCAGGTAGAAHLGTGGGIAMARLLTVILNWRTPDMTLQAAEAALAAMAGHRTARWSSSTTTRATARSRR